MDYFNNKTEKVAVYARVSTEHEAQILALDNQLEWYNQFLNHNPRYQEVARYVDEGISGTLAKKRPGFMQMIEDAKKGEFSLIITREVSRFARNTEEVLKYVKQLRKFDVDVYFAGDGFRTDESSGELRLTIMAAIAQNESRTISERVKCGQSISRLKGVFYGNGNILGYRRHEEKLDGGDKIVEFLINPEQAETVRMIYSWYLEGKGIRAIKFLLEEHGRKTAMGKTKWDDSTVSRILKNRFYCGEIEYGKQYSTDYLEQTRKNNYGEKPKSIVQGAHPAIIPKEDFERVQAIMEAHRGELKNVKTGHRPLGKKQKADVWSKLLQCECGCSFNRRKWSHKGGKTTYGYQCYSVARNGTVQTRLNKGLPIDDICKSPMVPAWKLKMMAKHVFNNIKINSDDILKQAKKLINQYLNVDTIEADNNLLAKKRQHLEKLKNRLQGLKNMRADGELTKEEFLESKQTTEAEIAEIEKTVHELENKANNKKAEKEKLNKRIKELEKTLDKLVKFSDKQDVPDNVIEAFVEKIVVTEDSCFQWYLRVAPEIAITYQVEGKRSETAKVIAPLHLLEFNIDIEKAKEYLYKKSTRHRIHNFKEMLIKIFF